MQHRLAVLSLWVCCLSWASRPALFAQQAPAKGVSASFHDLQLSEPPWSGSGFVQRLAGKVVFLAVLSAPAPGPTLPAGRVKVPFDTQASREAQVFAKRFNRWMHKEVQSTARSSALCAAVMARPPGVSLAPPPRNEADLALQRYLSELGYQWEILLAASSFETGGGLQPGHYLVFDAKGLLRYNGPQETKAEQILREALREAEQAARKVKR